MLFGEGVFEQPIEDTETALTCYGLAEGVSTTEQQQVEHLLLAIDGLKAQVDR